MSDRTGQQLGNYRLVRLLGQGGFADVYLGEHVHLNTYAAIKILRTQLAEDGMEDFRTEARTLAHLKHPNIVQVLDFGVDGLTPYFVMQYAPNGTLRQRHPRGVPVPLNLVISYVKQVAAALQYAHNQKLIHRDIKPENMLVGEQNQVLLSDFGIAVVTASARPENPALAAGSWSSAGTASYMAPEQIQGHTAPASDQYALATVVYEWLTGFVPFKGSYMEVVAQQMSATPAAMREKNPSIPPDVEQVVLTALNKDPLRRFGRVEVFATALEQAAQLDAVSPASAPSTTNSAPRPNITPNEMKEVPSMEAALVGPLGRTIIGPTKVTIGRAPDNTIVLSDLRASSHHAEVRPEGAYFSVVDLGSSNGTFVNEQQVFGNAPRLLQPGDMLRIGDTRFTFELAEASQSYSGGSTIRATPPPPPPAGAAPNFAGNTSYGIPENYGGYQGTVPAQPSYIPPQPSYTPPQPPYPYASETQMPTYVASTGQQPSYTPSQSPNYTPSSGQQPSYTPPAPVYNPPPPSQPKRSPVRAIILAVIALVIIAGGVGGYFVIQHNTQISNAHATATANANGTTTAAQATAQAIARATAQANATATALVTSHYPSFTTLALHDTLQANSGSQWDTGGECQFSSSGYQVSLAQQGHFHPCFAENTTFTDFAYQVNLVIQNGDCGGLVFRATATSNSIVYYVFEICSTGTYDLFVQQNASNATLLPSSSPTSTNIKQGSNQQNVIAVAVQGSSISMYVNNLNTPIATVTDLGNASTQGAIGVMADAVNTPTTVTFTNALVWTQPS